MNNINYEIVENFINTIDRSQPATVHEYNALLDSFLYGWNVETVTEIYVRLFKIYGYKAFL